MYMMANIYIIEREESEFAFGDTDGVLSGFLLH